MLTLIKKPVYFLSLIWIVFTTIYLIFREPPNIQIISYAQADEIYAIPQMGRFGPQFMFIAQNQVNMISCEDYTHDVNICKIFNPQDRLTNIKIRINATECGSSPKDRTDGIIQSCSAVDMLEANYFSQNHQKSYFLQNKRLGWRNFLLFFSKSSEILFSPK